MAYWGIAYAIGPNYNKVGEKLPSTRSFAVKEMLTRMRPRAGVETVRQRRPAHIDEKS